MEYFDFNFIKQMINLPIPISAIVIGSALIALSILKLGHRIDFPKTKKDYVLYSLFTIGLGALGYGVWEIHQGFNPARFVIASVITTGFILVVKKFSKPRLSRRIFVVLVGLTGAMIALNVDQYAVKLGQDISFSVGKLNISLLLVIKAYILFALLVWFMRKLINFIVEKLGESDSLTPSQQVLYEKLIRYTIYVVTALVGLNIIGIDMTALTIISGAIAFGIGFGLQKIFSNLISGIILLVDKSIKPGDVIALDDEYGMVTNLEARYASIVTRDGKKHLIPNERLVTETVENWSFQDEELRLSIFVGASYQDDPRLVEELLIECAKKHDRVLKTPPPFCLLKDFGDSSIDYELRFWIKDPNKGIGRLKSDIRFDIYKAFKANNVSIPYPHQELILRRGEHPTVATQTGAE